MKNHKGKITKAQIQAKKRYEDRNPEITRATKYKNTAKTFIRHYATEEDMKELNELYIRENKNYKEKEMKKRYLTEIENLEQIMVFDDLKDYLEEDEETEYFKNEEEFEWWQDLANARQSLEDQEIV